MARDLTLTAREALFSQETSEVFLILIDISHPDITDLHFVKNNEDITHNGTTYKAFNFEIPMPSEEDGSITEVDLVIDNVDRQIVDAIRSIDTEPTVTMKIVLNSDTDTVEAGPFDFKLNEAEYDILKVSGKLGMPSVLEEGFPGVNFTPINHPAML